MKPTKPISTRSYKLKDREDIIKNQVNREDQTTISYFPPVTYRPVKVERLSPAQQYGFFSNFLKGNVLPALLIYGC